MTTTTGFGRPPVEGAVHAVEYYGVVDVAGLIIAVRSMVPGDPIGPDAGAIALTAAQAAAYQTYWWDGSTLAERDLLPYQVDRVVIPADGTSSIHISGLPLGAGIYVPGLINPTSVPDGSVAIAAWQPGRYEVLLSAPPYLTASLWIEVIP